MTQKAFDSQRNNVHKYLELGAQLPLALSQTIHIKLTYKEDMFTHDDSDFDISLPEHSQRDLYIFIKKKDTKR